MKALGQIQNAKDVTEDDHGKIRYGSVINWEFIELV